MPTLIDTPFDRMPTATPLTVADAPLPKSMPHIRRVFADFCYLMLSTMGFIASSILMVLGLPLFIFFALSGWDIGLLAINLGNFADHFLTADADARKAFADDAKWAFIAVVAILHLTRMPGWFARLWDGLDRAKATNTSAVQ